ncbi:hypothetical protein KQI74_13800 [Paenibacillus barcinonensis]|uniref:hypothetical protein n=1 Tax=Paenibacillus barcinonensis TaxID=198119 RepID=UPI001C11EAD0|nr:hypothetical protein [Paenibacillus barcinonensis]MBU5353365.1 hypothetical protein [Paenibacillus barcinonensis]
MKKKLLIPFLSLSLCIGFSGAASASQDMVSITPSQNTIQFMNELAQREDIPSQVSFGTIQNSTDNDLIETAEFKNSATGSSEIKISPFPNVPNGSYIDAKSSTKATSILYSVSAETSIFYSYNGFTDFVNERYGDRSVGLSSTYSIAGMYTDKSGAYRTVGTHSVAFGTQIYYAGTMDTKRK